MLGEVIYIFEKDPRGPPVEVLQVYMDDADHLGVVGETDWDMVASYNVSQSTALR